MRRCTSNEITDSGFWMQGGAAQLHARLWRNVGVVADVAGSHVGNIDSSGVGLDMVTKTFGPLFTWSVRHPKLSIYGQVLVGEANAFNGVFPSQTGAGTSASSLAVLVGGGATVNCSRHLAVRVVEVDWLRTQLPNATTDVQNNPKNRSRSGLPIPLRIAHLASHWEYGYFTDSRPHSLRQNPGDVSTAIQIPPRREAS